MEITYTTEKVFTQQQIQDLFWSVRWVSGQYPEQLYKALLNSQTVLTAWDGDKLVGLVRVIDDGEILAYIHYVLVRPDYHGYEASQGGRQALLSHRNYQASKARDVRYQGRSRKASRRLSH